MIRLWLTTLALLIIAMPSDAEDKKNAKKISELKAAVQKAQATQKALRAKYAKELSAATKAKKETEEAYRKLLMESIKAEREAQAATRKAQSELRKAGGPFPNAKPKPVELQKLESAIETARKGIAAAQKNYTTSVRALHDFRREHIRDRDKAAEKKLKTLEAAIARARAGIKEANAGWFKAVHARNDFYRKKPKKPSKPTKDDAPDR